MTDEEKKEPAIPNQVAKDNNDKSVDPNEVKDTADEKKPEETKPTDAPAKTGDDEHKDEQSKPKVQTREQDHIEAEKRRAAKALAEQQEAKEKAIKEDAYKQGKLDALKENPYTHKAIKDEYDLRIYEAQKALDEQGKDPINDLAEYLAETQRESDDKAKKAQQEADERSKSEKEQADREVNELVQAYPNLDTAKEAQDPDYQDFAKDLFGKVSLKKIQDLYEIYKASKKPAVEPVKPVKPSVPSSAPGAVIPPKDFAHMSSEEYAAYERKKSGNYF